jgi:hypothetical protein
MKTKPYFLLGVALLGLTAGTLRAQLLTVDCGAVSTNAGAKLKFVNGSTYAASSGYVQPLTYQRISSRFGTNIVYCSTNLSFQALSAKTNPATAAAFGSYLACQVMSVSGPAGGVFSFWEQGAGWSTYDFPVNEIYSSDKKITLGNCETGAGRPDGDPFGNIRGRRFVVNKPGDYFVTFKLVDTSANHPTLAKTPIQAPSDTLTIKFSTKIDLGIMQFGNTNGVATLVYKPGFLTNLFVESSTNSTGPWTPIAGPFTNTPALTTNLFTTDPSMPAVFYRLHGVTAP